VAIAGFFKTFEETQRERKRTLLQKGVGFFEALLRFDAAKVLEAIEEEIKTVQEAAEAAKAKKAEEVQMQCLPLIDELLKLKYVNQTIAQR
jgi:hypothetical protein